MMPEYYGRRVFQCGERGKANPIICAEFLRRGKFSKGGKEGRGRERKGS